MENKETKKFNKTFSAFLDTMRNGGGQKVKAYTGKVVKFMYLGIFLIGATAMYNLFTSEISGDFKIYEHNAKTGKTEILRFKAKKLQPKMQVKNILSLEYHSDGSRGVDYKRHVGQLFSFQIYMGGGASVMRDGKMTYKGGVSLGF